MQRRDVIKSVALMLGAGLSPGCRQALMVPASERVMPELNYGAAEQETLHLIAELIIPTTDTPGAREAGVGEFIDYTVNTWFAADERAAFLAGLRTLDDQGERTFAAPFRNLTEQQQISLLERTEASEPIANLAAIYAGFANGGFFSVIKELTVVGYYTSEIGAKVERAYVPMPGRYDGHYKYASVGKQWAS
jgi:hypothetical protein